MNNIFCHSDNYSCSDEVDDSWVCLDGMKCLTSNNILSDQLYSMDMGAAVREGVGIKPLTIITPTWDMPLALVIGKVAGS